MSSLPLWEPLLAHRGRFPFAGSRPARTTNGAGHLRTGRINARIYRNQPADARTIDRPRATLRAGGSSLKQALKAAEARRELLRCCGETPRHQTARVASAAKIPSNAKGILQHQQGE